MSNENDFVASLNRLQNRIDSDQAELNRRYGLLREEINKLKSPHSALDQINNLLAVLVGKGKDNQDLGDLSHLIRELKTVASRQSNDHTSTTSAPDLDATEIGDNGTVKSVNIPDELGTEGHVYGIETNVPSTGTTNDGTHLSQLKSANEQANGDSLDPQCSSCQLSIPPCKRVKTEDFDPDCGCAECLFNKKKLETRNNAQIVAQVKKEEVESGDENDIGHEDGDQLNDNQNESLHEQSNGPNQSSVNDNNPIDHVDQQVDNGGDDPNESAIDEYNEPQTSKQFKVSKPRKRKGADKSLVAESEKLLDNSLPSKEVSPPVRRTRSQNKRARVTSQLEKETIEQLSTGSEVDSIEGDIPDGDDSSGEEDVDQSEDEGSLQDDDAEMNEDTEMDEDTEVDDDIELDDEEGGYYKIVMVNLKCHECSVVVAGKPELGNHFRDEHDSLPYRCLAEGCSARFEHWDGQALVKHAQDKHSAIPNWTCSHCPTKFQTLKSVYAHLHKSHFEGTFRCGYDGCPNREIATLRSTIKNHQYKVHPNPVTNKIYKCDYADCGRTFKKSGNFKVHLRVHTGDRPYRCELDGCGKTFSQQSIYKRHQRSHQGVKSYRCKECGYAATEKSGVIKHIRTQHFNLPVTQKKQDELGIKDNRDPHDYLEEITTHQ